MADARKIPLVGGPAGIDLVSIPELARLVAAEIARQAQPTPVEPAPIEQAPIEPVPVVVPPVPTDPIPETPTDETTPWMEDQHMDETPVIDAAPAPTVPGRLIEVEPVSTFSEEPFGYNRLQIEHPAYEDEWQMKESEIAVENAPGFPDETPELLFRHGRTQVDAKMFYGDGGRASWGLPTKNQSLFFEYSGGDFEPYRSPFDVLTTDIHQIGLNLKNVRLPRWNNNEGDGLIDGVATVREAHLNLEYAWLTLDDWNRWSYAQRQTLFFNYVAGRTETLQQCFDREGLNGLSEALHQKWRNIIGLAILIINRICPGVNAYYGDHSGIAPIHSIKDFSGNYSLSDLFSSSVNDASRFPQANEYLNAGRVTLDGEVFDVSGNLRALSKVAHCYNYEDYVMMRWPDYGDYQQATGDIHAWHDKLVPNLHRPYDICLHAELTQYVKLKKNWPDFRTYWQTEPIYESSIVFPDKNWERVGAWVPWTNNTCKIPLHPEVSRGLVFNARLHLDGLFVWGKNRRQYLEKGQSENSHPQLHQVGREGIQIALDQINQVRAFTPDTQILTGSIQIKNDDRNEWFAGDAASLLRRNGSADKAVPLVTGVYNPKKRLEVYSVYALNPDRYTSRIVPFLSPIDGAELRAEARGWGPTLYARRGAQLINL
ncbi:hypothetical protein [Spirosoma fluminis]